MKLELIENYIRAGQQRSSVTEARRFDRYAAYLEKLKNQLQEGKALNPQDYLILLDTDGIELAINHRNNL